MPQEYFELKTSTANANGSVKKEGVILTIAFATTADKGNGNISTSWSFSGAEKAMKALFASWPVNFDDIGSIIQNPIDVHATIALATTTTAAQVNQIAGDAAKAAEATAKAAQDAKTPSLDKVGDEIKQLAT